MLPPISQKLIVHIDMNSYFASVEQQANVSLRGRPLGVCAYLREYGCVIAASIEAKRLGMKVGMSVKDARERVPSAVFVENDPAKYRAVTSRIFSILHEMTDKVEHYSIDEAFLDFTGWYRDAAEAAWAMTRVRQRITNEVGDWLRCSIGIAPTRFLAKTASDFEKPNGLVVIDRENLDEMLAKLDLEDVCGIGPRIRKRLERIGIKTLLDVKKYPVGNLMRVFGKYGLYLWCKLHAMEFERVTNTQDALPKSVGHSYCVPDRVNRDGKVVPTLMRLTERAGRRLRALGMEANGVSVAVGFRAPGFAKPNGPFWQPMPGEGGSIGLRLPEAAADSFTLVGTATDLLKELWRGQSVNFLAVTLTDLSMPSAQMRFVDGRKAEQGAWHAPIPGSWDPRADRRRLASSAVDAIRDRYGDQAIVFGEMLKLGDEAPDRIGFRKVEGLELTR